MNLKYFHRMRVILIMTLFRPKKKKKKIKPQNFENRVTWVYQSSQIDSKTKKLILLHELKKLVKSSPLIEQVSLSS